MGVVAQNSPSHVGMEVYVGWSFAANFSLDGRCNCWRNYGNSDFDSDSDFAPILDLDDLSIQGYMC